MKRWSMLVVIAIVALLTAMFSANVSAQDQASQGASLSINKSAEPTSASLGDTITYTFTIANTGNVSVDNVTLKDDKLGEIALSETRLAPGDNVTAIATYTVDISDLPGPIVNTANVTGTDPAGKSVSATSNSVTVSLNKSLMTKAEILKLSGVPGKGIDKAPGLQKPFNPKSKAAEHAGKKNQAYDEEATDDKGEAKPKVKKQLKTRSRAEIQAYDDEAADDKDEAKPKIKKQLKTKSRVKNQP